MHIEKHNRGLNCCYQEARSPVSNVLSKESISGRINSHIDSTFSLSSKTQYRRLTVVTNMTKRLQNRRTHTKKGLTLYLLSTPLLQKYFCNVLLEKRSFRSLYIG